VLWNRQSLSVFSDSLFIWTRPREHDRVDDDRLAFGIRASVDGVTSRSGNGSAVRVGKSEIRISNSKQSRMSDDENSKPYDLEERTVVFAEQSRAFVKRLPRTIGNIEMLSNLFVPQAPLAQITSKRMKQSERRIL